MGIPTFEIETWPYSELEIQAAFISIDENNDQPYLKYVKEDVTVEEMDANLKRVLG